MVLHPEVEEAEDLLDKKSEENEEKDDGSESEEKKKKRKNNGNKLGERNKNKLNLAEFS